MYKKFLFFVFTLSFSFCFAQFNCGLNEAILKLETQNPQLKLNTDINSPSYQLTNVSNLTSFTIPVVFHILHLSGNENISDAQVNSAVSVLNRDFNKKNADTTSIVPAFQNIATRCNISFSLANIDPNGKCTNGITRHYDTRTNWQNDLSNYLYTWPPSKYMNIYVVKTMMSGVAGYAYLPGTAALQADAIVILNNYVGEVGTGNSGLARALTHEVGHWLNLNHTWGNTNNPGVACGDDGVSDTPITKGFTNCTLNNSAICTNGVQENVQNYMEYAYCSNMFTSGQKTRMHSTLNNSVGGRNNLSTNANLIATGVLSPPQQCGPTAEFGFNKKITCVGNTLNFTQYCYNGAATNFNWSSPNASNTSILQNGTLTFNSSGNTNVKLKASNSFGTDSITKNNFIILSSQGTGQTNTLQDFENFAIPNLNWIIDYPQYGSSFSLTTINNTKSYYLNNYFDNPNEAVTLYTPDFNIVDNSFSLKFRYAYSQTSVSNNDNLQVAVSKDCAQNWTTIFNKSGANLSTTGALNQSPFTPTLTTEWMDVTLPLPAFSGNNRVYFKFKFTPDVNGAGNNFYIDNIEVVNTPLGVKTNQNASNITIYPNPSNSAIHINTTDKVSDLKLYNSLGICVLQEHNSSKHINNFNVENIQKGCYTLIIKTSKETSVKKIVVN